MYRVTDSVLHLYCNDNLVENKALYHHLKALTACAILRRGCQSAFAPNLQLVSIGLLRFPPLKDVMSVMVVLQRRRTDQSNPILLVTYTYLADVIAGVAKCSVDMECSYREKAAVATCVSALLQQATELKLEDMLPV